MAITNQAPSKTFAATSTGVKQFHFAVQASATTANVATVSKTYGLMVAQENALAVGQLIEFAQPSPGYETYLKVDNVYAVNQVLKSTTSATGTAVTTTGDYIQAVMREASTAANDIVRVELMSGRHST